MKPEDLLQAARAALARGDPEGTLSRVGAVLSLDPDRREAYDLAARALEGKRGPGLLFRLCHDHFEDARYFYRLGFQFMAADLPHLARPILERAHRLAPDDPNTAVELAVARAETGAHAAARDLLRQLPPELLADRPNVLFLLGWCELLTGNLEEARRANRCLAAVASQPGFDPRLAERLRLALRRAEAMGLPPPDDLRRWHFLQYGGAILDVSAQPGMGGRYGFLQEPYPELGRRLRSLARWLAGLGLSPRAVATPPGDRDAEILGRALAALLARPWRELGEGLAPETLVVAGRPDPLARRTDLRRRGGVWLYVHVLPWTRSAPLTPDVAGFLAEGHRFPWQGGIRPDPETGRPVERPPDPRPAEAVAAHLVSHIPERAGLPRQVLAFYRRYRRLSLYGGGPDVHYRLPFRQESPVPGQRFR